MGATASSLGIIIDLKEKPTDDEYHAYRGRGIKAKRSEEPQGSNFYKYTYAVPTGGSFTVKEIKDDNGKKVDVSELKGVPKVTSVFAYYWRYDKTGQKPTKALLIGATAGSRPKNKIKYYARGSDTLKWYSPTISFFFSNQHLTGELLEKELDDLTCEHNNAVTINLTETHSENHRNGQKYCCGYHNSKNEAKVTVTKQEVSCGEGGHDSIHIPYFKHEIYDGSSRLTKIKYYENGNQRKRIKLKDHDFPIDSPLTLYFFYCTGNYPKLIYINGTGKKQVNGWFKKPDNSDSNGDEQWEKVPGLPDKGPESIIDCDKYNQLVEVLNKISGYNSYQKCPGPKVSESDQPEETPTEFSTEKLEADSLGTSQLSRDDSTWTLIGVSTGVGLTFGTVYLVGWKLYKRYKQSDRWIRQI
ncbi:hypothetical protein BEWA_001030 [Theileria equi strain WA]|uniref:Uncharacterized protein n=1 Tax=Theileria equi strain WA TaxID=1537102 RepID=L0B0A5_THEEQ|nr:hypothetical protein BEWA_001030 [Theileria equi strain WA]AFZ80696.1 hypothetical protein BEWA_001030 [Theileria equi strain WA]|eukprot:XP_004830362.1 hypothetical protein BEWA_001030 [Theileria equi strain WA]